MSGLKTLLGASGLVLAFTAAPQSADAHGWGPALGHGHVMLMTHQSVVVGAPGYVLLEPMKDKDGNLMGFRDPRSGPLFGGYLVGGHFHHLLPLGDTLYKHGDALFLRKGGSKELVPLDMAAFKKGLVKPLDMRVR